MGTQARMVLDTMLPSGAHARVPGAGEAGVPEFLEEFERSATPVRQNGLDGPWIAEPSPEHARRFGFFVVLPVARGGPDSRYPHALLLDYGASTRNPRRSPTRGIRDYLVRPDERNPDLLLGKGCPAVGGAGLFPQFFVLERLAGAAAWTP